MASGDDPATDTPIADITLPYPENGGGTLAPLMASSEQETLDYTRYRETTGAKLRYNLSYSFLPVSLYNTLLNNLVLSATSKDVYFKYARWSQSLDWVEVLINIGSQDVKSGLDDVSTSIDITEVNSRI